MTFRSLMIEDEAKSFWPPGGTYRPRPRDILVVETDQWTAIEAPGTTLKELRDLPAAKGHARLAGGVAFVRVVKRSVFPPIAHVWLRFHGDRLRVYKAKYDSSG